jgi:hypothetical protein
MLSLIQRLLPPPTALGIPRITETTRPTGVLALTADICLYSGVLNAASSIGWRTEWARTLRRGIEICNLESTPIVIYDANLPGIEWGTAFDLLSSGPIQRRILLAARCIDEDLWRNVLRRHGYDIVERSASSEELRTALRFARLSLLSRANV